MLLYSLYFICAAMHSSGWLSPHRAPSLWPLADLYSTPTLPTSTSLFPSPLITTKGSICREAVYSFCPSAICVHFLGGRFYKPVDIHRVAGAVSRRLPQACSIRANYQESETQLLQSWLFFCFEFCHRYCAKNSPPLPSVRSLSYMGSVGTALKKRRAAGGSVVAAAVCEVYSRGCCGSHMTRSLHTAAFEAPELFTPLSEQVG